jgi:hypothetical protein
MGGNHRLVVRVSVSERRHLGIVALGLVLVAAAVAGFFMWRGAATSSAAQVVVDDAATPSGWKTVDYEGVRVDIPSEWARSDRRDCEFAFERWAQPDEVGCDAKGDGVSFYVSATFDPKHGPGVMRGDATVDGAAWAPVLSGNVDRVVPRVGVSGPGR